MTHELSCVNSKHRNIWLTCLVEQVFSFCGELSHPGNLKLKTFYHKYPIFQKTIHQLFEKDHVCISSHFNWIFCLGAIWVNSKQCIQNKSYSHMCHKKPASTQFSRVNMVIPFASTNNRTHTLLHKFNNHKSSIEIDRQWFHHSDTNEEDATRCHCKNRAHLIWGWHFTLYSQIKSQPSVLKAKCYWSFMLPGMEL